MAKKLKKLEGFSEWFENLLKTWGAKTKIQALRGRHRSHCTRDTAILISSIAEIESIADAMGYEIIVRPKED
jgi:hypothetical protein